MKKQWKKLLCAALCLCVLCACGGGDAKPAESGRPRIVATIFPLYDWTRQILGRRAADVDLTLLVGAGTDMHSYQPSVEDIVRVSEADLFIYVGGESDQWIEDALKEASNPRMRALNLMKTIGGAALEEAVLPGMEAEPGDGISYDEHIWLSLKNAFTCCQAIAQTLESMGVLTRYESEVDEYSAKLFDLDALYLAAAQSAPLKTVLFADRFPFRYLADDYGLEAYAAFQGCSAETEASFETVAFLSAKLAELDLPAVLTTESADGKLAETIIRTAGTPGTPILRMDSMQSATAEEIASGAGYLSIMEGNLEVLRRALGAAQAPGE